MEASSAMPWTPLFVLLAIQAVTYMLTLLGAILFFARTTWDAQRRATLAQDKMLMAAMASQESTRPLSHTALAPEQPRPNPDAALQRFHGDNLHELAQ